MEVKYRNFVFYKPYFLIKICWNCFCLFVVWLYNFITHNHWIFATTCWRISNQHLSLFQHWFELHCLPPTLLSHSHDICFVNVFDLYISVIIFNTLRFKSYVSFGTHTLLGKSLRVIELPTHVSNLAANGLYWSSWLYLGWKLIRVSWIKHFWLLNDMHFVWLDLLTRSTFVLCFFK